MLSLLLLASAWPLRAEQARSADGVFTVEAPDGWRVQAPKPGYLISMAPGDGKGGLTLSLGPANVTSEEQARAALQALAAQVDAKLHTGFGRMETLDTPQPGRMVFVEGRLGGKPYLLGYDAVDGRLYRVDVLADQADGAANYVLSSLRAAGTAAAPKRKADQASPADGRFIVSMAKGWLIEPSDQESEVLLKTDGGDRIQIGYEPGVHSMNEADGRAKALAQEAGTKKNLRISDPRQFTVEDVSIHYFAGHGPGELVDTSLFGVFKDQDAYFHLIVEGAGGRPFDLAQSVLERFRLKGQSAAASSDAPGAAAAPPPDAGPTNEQLAVAAKFKSKQSSGGEGYAWKLLGLMATVPLLVMAGFALLGRIKKSE